MPLVKCVVLTVIIINSKEEGVVKGHQIEMPVSELSGNRVRSETGQRQTEDSIRICIRFARIKLKEEVWIVLFNGYVFNLQRMTGSCSSLATV